MLIESISVENFGTISERIELEFGPGLNIVYGPNETGKSTLMKAIWFAMTRRAQSGAQDIKAIEPDTGGTPKVELHLRIGDERFEMTKIFGGTGGSAHLRQISADGDIREFSDDQADEQLRRALGFSESTDRSKTPDHFGLWPLTWVRQGEDQSDPGAHLQREGEDDKLTRTLGELTGEALAGDEGRRILEAAKEEVRKFYTPSGGHTSKEGAPLAEAQKKLEEAQRLLSELEGRERHYREDLERYGKLEAAIEELGDKELPSLKEELKKAEEDARQVERLKEQLQSVQASQKAAAADVEKWQKVLDERRELRDKLENSREKIDELQAETKGLREDLEALRGGRGERETARTSAEEARDKARSRVKILEALQETLYLGEKTENARQTLDTVEKHHAQLIDLRGELKGIAVDDAAVDELNILKRRVETKETELRAASARLEINALQGTTLQIGGQDFELATGQRREEVVDEPMTLRIDDLVEIGIRPGGQELGELREQLDEAKTAFDNALSRFAVSSLSQAEKLARRRARLENDEQSKTRLIEGLVPEGVDLFQEKVKSLETRQKAAQKRLEELSDGDSELPDDEEACRAALAEANDALEQSSEALEESRRQLTEYDRRLQSLEHQVELAEQKLAAQSARRQETEEDLARSIDLNGEDEKVRSKLHKAEDEESTHREKIDDFEERLHRLQADAIEARLKRCRRAFQNTERKLLEKRDEMAALRGRLEHSDLQGLHEKLADARERERRAGSEVERWTRRAEAAKLLYDTLTRAQQEIRQAYLQPLRESVATLLQQLFPKSNIEFGDQFEIAQLSRHREGADHFDRLSFGSREQLSVVIRLAMARLLAEHGEALPVFLDDVLTSTDDSRFERMANVFTHVADDLQLIVATCHWSRFRRLGADKVIDLEATIRDAGIANATRAKQMALTAN